MERIGVGLIGYGMAGSVFHGPLIASEPRLHLKSVVTSRTEQVARELPGTQVVAETEAVFKDPEIQLVVVATPNQTHFQIAQRRSRPPKTSLSTSRLR